MVHSRQKRKILITGSSGYIGRNVCDYLSSLGHDVIAVTRNKLDKDIKGQKVVVRDFRSADWTRILVDVDIVIHCAGLAHNRNADLKKFLEANVESTKPLVNASSQMGVGTFVFISSIAVYGNDNLDGCINTLTPERPADSNGKTKFICEEIIRSQLRSDTTTTLILRVPMIYGPNCPGNFAKLFSISNTNLPLPIKGAHAKRHYLNIKNLCSALAQCLFAGRHESGTYLIADQNPTNLAELVANMRGSLKKNSNLFYVPTPIMKFILAITKNQKLCDVMYKDCLIDSSRFSKTFKWAPQFDINDGIVDYCRTFFWQRRSDASGKKWN